MSSVETLAEMVRADVGAVLPKYLAITIKDQVSYQAVADGLNDVRGLLKRAHEIFGPAIKAAHEAHKATIQAETTATEDLRKGEAVLLSSLRTWDTTQAEIRRKAEKVAADALAAESRRVEVERAEQERMAREAEGGGTLKFAREVREIPGAPTALPTVPVPAPIKAEGLAARVTYSAEVTDLRALVDAVAAGRAPIETLKADEVMLNGQARKLGTEGLLYPGVKAVGNRSYAGTRR